jgi:hypothetical protein
MSKIDSLLVEKALQKIYNYALKDGDIGCAEWNEVSRLIRQAQIMQARIGDLEAQVAEYQSQLRRLTCLNRHHYPRYS